MYRPEDVVSGSSTPTFPVPALTRSASFGMYVKFASNELMLRSDGTVAGVVVDPVFPPPQAARITPATAKAGNRRASFMRTYLSKFEFSCCLLPEAFLARGESAPANRCPTQPPGPRQAEQSIAHPPKFVKSAMV